MEGAITTERTKAAYSMAMDLEMAIIAALVAQSKTESTTFAF